MTAAAARGAGFGNTRLRLRLRARRAIRWNLPPRGVPPVGRNGMVVTTIDSPLRSHRAPWWQPGGDLQTVIPHLVDRSAPMAVTERIIVEVAPGSAVRVTLTEPPLRSRGTLLLVHGLAGSSASRAVVVTASRALSRGWTVARLDLRNCGGTAALASTLYNTAQSADLAAVLATLESRRLPRPFAVAGFSLGGNLALRYAGIEGGRTGLGAPPDAVVAVNPPIDLLTAASTIEQPSRVGYRLFFTHSLLRLLRDIRAHRAVPGPPASLRHIRGVREFDAAFTAPDGGWESVEDYYAEGSSRPHLGAITAPTLILTTSNDPVINPSMFRGVATNQVRVHVAPSGGHVGYWSGLDGGADRFWAGDATLDFLDALPD